MKKKMKKKKKKEKKKKKKKRSVMLSEVVLLLRIQLQERWHDIVPGFQCYSVATCRSKGNV